MSELNEERLDAMERRCYRLDDSRITEAERYVHQLVAEVRRLRQELATCELYREGFRMGKDNALNQRNEARGLAMEYLHLLWQGDSEVIMKAGLEKDIQLHPWLLGPELPIGTGVAEAVFGITQIEE